jgi:hypothetical protein
MCKTPRAGFWTDRFLLSDGRKVEAQAEAGEALRHQRSLWLEATIKRRGKGGLERPDERQAVDVALSTRNSRLFTAQKTTPL